MKHIAALFIGVFLIYKGVTELMYSGVEIGWQITWFVITGGATLGIIYHWYLEKWKI